MLAVVNLLAGDRVGERAGPAAQPGPALQQRDPQALGRPERRPRRGRPGRRRRSRHGEGEACEPAASRREADSRLMRLGWSSWEGGLQKPLRQGSQGDRRLAPGGNRHPARQDVVVAPGDLVEQGPVDPHDRQQNRPADRLDEGRQIPGLFVVTVGPPGLEASSSRSRRWAGRRSARGARRRTGHLVLGR